MLHITFTGRESPIFRERSPGLIQHVLTVLVFWSWVLLLPRLAPLSWSLRLFFSANILLHGPLDICLDLLPAAPYNWETDFYTPPVLGGAALFGNSAPAVYKKPVPEDPEFYTPLALNCQKGGTSHYWRCIKISLPTTRAKTGSTTQVFTKQGGTRRVFWVHANRSIILNGGVACVCAKWRVFVYFCAFLRVFFCTFLCVFPTKMGDKKKNASLRGILQKSAESAFMQYPL